MKIKIRYLKFETSVRLEDDRQSKIKKKMRKTICHLKNKQKIETTNEKLTIEKLTIDLLKTSNVMTIEQYDVIIAMFFD